MIKHIIILVLAAQAQCTFVIDYVIVNPNEKYTNVSVKVINGNSINARLEVFKTIKKMKMQFKINIPLDENDKSYQKEAFKTSVDWERLSKGVQGNFIIKVLMENFFKSIDVQLTLPMKPGNYTVTNWTIDDSKVPIPLNTKAVFESRQFGIVEGVKSSVHLFSYRAFFSINKSLG